MAGGAGAPPTAGLTNTNVYALAIDPPQTPRLCMRVPLERGVFKSSNGGGSWAAANTGLTNLSVQALAINPTTPATLYAGTGGGVFRSTDSGGTWAAFNTGLPNLPVDALAFDPTGDDDPLRRAGGRRRVAIDSPDNRRRLPHSSLQAPTPRASTALSTRRTSRSRTPAPWRLRSR